MMMTKKKKKGPSRYLPVTLFRCFSRLFMAFLSGLFGSFSGAFPHSQKEERTKYHGKERLRRKPFFFPRQQGQLSSRRANPHSKKEWGPLTARRTGKKEGPTIAEETKPTPRKKCQLTISRRKGQFEGRAKNHTKKTGPIPDRQTPTPRRKGQQPHHDKERAKHQPREARANKFREGRNNLHSEGQIQEGPSSHSKKAWRTSSTAAGQT